MGCKTLAFVGRSRSGKTTLISKIIPKLNEKGIKVATIKHTHHNVEFDQPGKDSWVHRQAGAEKVMLLSEKEMAIFGKRQHNSSLGEIRDQWFSEYDLLLVEGFKNEPVTKIEVVRKDNEAPPLYKQAGFIVDALVTDDLFLDTIPCFLPNEIEKLISWICRTLDIR